MEHLQARILAPEIESCPTKAALQQSQLPGVKLKKYFISYRRFKTQKHSVSIGVSCTGFSLYEHFNRYLLIKLFYIQNRKVSLSKTLLLDTDKHVLT